VQLGCGITGLVCAEQLEKNSKVTELILADARTDAAEAVALRLNSGKIAVSKVNATEPAELKKLLTGTDLVISSMPWMLNKRTLDMAASVGTDYVDFCLTVDKIEEFEPARKMCEDAGITAITAAGEDPGISDCFARRGADLLDEAWEAHVMDGDSGSAEGYDFFSLWSPIDLLEETTVPSAVFVDGKWGFVPPLHEKEVYEFPAPIGPLPVYKTNHEETYLMPSFIKGLKVADFRIAIDDNFAATARMLRKLGLHSLQPIDVKGVKVKPLDVVVALMPRPFDLSGKVKGHAAIVVEVIGVKNGEKTMVKMWTMMSHERAYEICKSNATGYLVGVGGAVAAEMVLEGEVRGKGLFAPEQLSAEKFLSRVASKGLDVKEEIRSI
jgi:saccharopine dehydrogenase-like NADP-dependent oxidoreductase